MSLPVSAAFALSMKSRSGGLPMTIDAASFCKTLSGAERPKSALRDTDPHRMRVRDCIWPIVDSGGELIVLPAQGFQNRL
jgi:hypothetical protein